MQRSRTINAIPRDEEATMAGGEPVVAHLNGGPLDGEQRMLFRLRPELVAPAPRGRTRRLLRMHRLRVRYELEESWDQGAMHHARYVFAPDGRRRSAP